MSGFRGFLLKRLIFSILTVLIITTFVFVLFRAVPGDPTTYLVDPAFDPEVSEEILKKFGLDKPLWQQYGIYIWNLVQGDLGLSFNSRKPVIEELGLVLPNTLILIFTSLLIAYPLGILIGAFQASKRGKWQDSLGISLALLYRSAPIFWTGMIALMIFSFNLGWFPTGRIRDMGYASSNIVEKYVNLDFLHHLALPAIVAGLFFTALPLTLTRGSVLEVLEEDYIELVRAKGLPERTILLRHGVRNAILPVVTAFAVHIGIAVAGMVELEVIFSWPGLGKAIVDSLRMHDYPVAQGSFLLLAIMVSVMSLIADLTYGYLDPRITFH